MGTEEFFDNISVTPALVDDQGDIFQCGRCKLTFSTLIEFLSHKRLHYNQQMDQIPSQVVLETDQVETAPFSEPSGQVWVWNSSATMQDGELLGQSHFCVEKNINDATKEPCCESSNITYLNNDNVKLKTGTNQPCCESSNITYLNNDNVNLKTGTNQPCCESSNITYLNNDNVNLKTGTNQETTVNVTIENNVAPVDNSPTCSVCQKVFKTQFDLFLHFRSHTGEKPYQCIICGRTFSLKSNLKKHMHSHRVWPDGISKTLMINDLTENPGYTCSYCQKVFTDYMGLKIHLKEHGHQKVYKCIQKKCIDMFIDLDSLVSHVKTDHHVSEYHCHICSAILSSLEDMSNHLQTHKPSASKTKQSSKYTCIYCHTDFKKPSYLSHHLATANHANYCPVCDKCFVSERSLRRHLQLHNAIKAFRCDVCGKKFITKYYLEAHLLTHTKEKCFSCSYCDVKCARKDILLRHIKIHQPNKKKCCPYRAKLGCIMEFTRTDKLNLHIKTHTDNIKSRKTLKDKNSIKLLKKQSTIEIIIVPLSKNQC